MNIKKVLFLLLLPLLAEVVISCCDCSDSTYFRYTNHRLTLASLDNSGPSLVETTSTDFVKAAYGMRLRIFTEKTALREQQAVFLGAAYATSCDCPPELQYTAKDSITSIQIISLRDFDASHPAGSEVTAYFKRYQPHWFTTIRDYLKSDAPVFFNEEERVITIDLLLMTPPAAGPAHRFRVEVGLSDGRLLQAETATVELL